MSTTYDVHPDRVTQSAHALTLAADRLFNTAGRRMPYLHEKNSAASVIWCHNANALHALSRIVPVSSRQIRRSPQKLFRRNTSLVILMFLC